MQENEPETDRFEQRLETMLQTLKSCQESQGVASCSACEKLLECELRSAYVGSVYDSMSKGETGGFEF